jgi:hypothetical protein
VIEKPVVLYMDAALIDAATPEPPGAACGKCALFRSDGDCDVLAPPEVSPAGVCGLFIGGPPAVIDYPPQGLVPADVAGYTDQGPTMCGNCTYFLKPSRCRIVAGPVEAGGCCNAWEPKGGQRGA